VLLRSYRVLLPMGLRDGAGNNGLLLGKWAIYRLGRPTLKLHHILDGRQRVATGLRGNEGRALLLTPGLGRVCDKGRALGNRMHSTLFLPCFQPFPTTLLGTGPASLAVAPSERSPRTGLFGLGWPAKSARVCDCRGSLAAMWP